MYRNRKSKMTETLTKKFVGKVVYPCGVEKQFVEPSPDCSLDRGATKLRTSVLRLDPSDGDLISNPYCIGERCFNGPCPKSASRRRVKITPMAGFPKDSAGPFRWAWLVSCTGKVVWY
jgi:hypothetical protein